MSHNPKSIHLAGLLIVLVGLFLIIQPALAAAETKIGVFDLTRAVNTSKKGQAAKAKLVSKFERLQKDLKTRETELENLRTQLESQASTLSAEAMREKEKDLQRKARDFQEVYRDYNEEMQKEEMENTKPVVDGLLREANHLGKEGGYTLILEVNKSGIIYAPETLDITNDVIKRFDSK